MDGIQCTKAVRKLGYSAPIVALTAYAEESNQKVCLDAGMDDFLVKPINKQHLRHVLDLYTLSTNGPRSVQTSSSITEMSMGLPTPPLSSIISQSRTPLLAGEPELTPDTNDSKTLE
jgi:osomolarity two-component system sensor histidine kinase SLN1